MTVTPEQQGRNNSRSDASAANLFEGGALGFMDRVGDAMTKRFDEMYSSENLHKMMDKALENLPPEIREGLSQLFNALSGALSGNDPAKSQEYETIKEVYGTGGTDKEAVRMNSNFAQRDDAQFAAAVTIGNGSGAITEVNGIQYVDGRPVNDSDEEAAEFAEQMGRERAWDQSRVNVGGVELSGEEWDRALENLSDEKTRQEIEDDLTEEYGGDRRRAKKALADAMELAKIAARVKNGTATAADTQRAADINRNNPDAGDAIKQAADRTEGFKPAARAVENSRLEAQASGQRESSANERSNLIASQTDFNAKPITAIYNTAAQGKPETTEPVAPKIESGNEVVMAAASSPRTTPAMNANLDMG